MNGVLVIDKPKGMTSFAVVAKVRRALGVKKVGHTGTLDPMATGVLVVCVGEGTKIAGLLAGEDKVYEVTGLLGVETDTLDITGKETARHDPSRVCREEVENALETFVGEIEQVPPAFSAVHTDGERAYEKARRGEEVNLSARRVKINRLNLKDWREPYFDFCVECSKGTYVRSLVADLGKKLGCGATLAALRRVRNGYFDLGHSVSLEELASKGPIQFRDIDSALLHLPAVEVDEEQAKRVRQGQPLDIDISDGLVRIKYRGKIIALGERRDGRLWPKRVFCL
ncbi:MAG: tRNA pseudouridine(55) synthase TruB [Pseudomonadota bacterium]